MRLRRRGCRRPGLAALRVDPPPPGSERITKIERHTLIWIDPLPEGGRAVFKMYRQRSLPVFWRERVTRFRVEREYEVLNHLSQRDVPCPEPLCWTHGRSAEHGRYEVLATREIRGATSLRELARSGEHRRMTLDLGLLFRTVRRMHDSGVYHAVLKTDNVLVAPGPGGGQVFYIVDTPRALLFPRSIVGTPMAWRDLQHLSHGLIHYLELSPDRIPLRDYGLDESTQREFGRRLESFRRTKRRRWRLRWEFLARWFLARFVSRA